MMTLGAAILAIAVAGCVSPGDVLSGPDSGPTQQEGEAVRFEAMKQSIVQGARSVADVAIEPEISGTTRRLSIVIAVPGGEIVAEELRAVLVAVDESRTPEDGTIRLRAVRQLDGDVAFVPIREQLLALGVPESRIVEEHYATIPEKVLRDVLADE